MNLPLSSTKLTESLYICFFMTNRHSDDNFLLETSSISLNKLQFVENTISLSSAKLTESLYIYVSFMSNWHSDDNFLFKTFLIFLTNSCL